MQIPVIIVELEVLTDDLTALFGIDSMDKEPIKIFTIKSTMVMRVMENNHGVN